MYPPFDAGPELLARRIYVLIKCGRDYRLPYGPRGWEAVLSGDEYPGDFGSFLSRFLAALRDGSWAPGSYFPGGWYRMLKAQGKPVLRVAVTPQALAPFFGDEMRIDTTGQWTVGHKVITGSVLHFFLRHLQYDADVGRYVVRYDLETHVETRYVHHESLPFRVLALNEKPEGWWLSANDGTQEQLRWDTLRMDADEKLYCAIRPERLPAQFGDGPRFRLLDSLAERNGRWIAKSGGSEHVLTLDAPWPGSGSLVPLPPVHGVRSAEASPEPGAER